MAGHSHPKDGVASARLCPGHPRLLMWRDSKTWMPATSAGMTSRRLWLPIQAARSALGDQRRRRVDWRAHQIPAHAELDVLRGDVLHHEAAAVDDGDAVEGIGRTGDAIAEVDVTIGQFDREPWRHLVGQTCVKR